MSTAQTLKVWDMTAKTSIAFRDISARVFDIFGREVASVSGHALNTSALASGVYLCSVRVNGVAMTKRLVVVR